MRRTDTGWRLMAMALAWIAGVALQLQQAALSPSGAYLVAVALGLVSVGAAWRWRRAFAIGVIGAASLAWGASGWRATAVMGESLSSTLEDQDLVVTGIVASLPQIGPTGLRFRFDVDAASVRGEAAVVPSQVTLGWYRGFHEDAALTQPQRELRAGQRWRFTVRLRRPHGNLNPYGFDYELMLFELGVRATGYVRDAQPLLLDRAAGHPIERLRQRVRDAIYASVPDRRAAGVLAALTIGDQGAIEHDDWDLFRNAGVAHLMSISGLHVTMFAWLAGLGVNALWRRSSRLTLAWPAAKAARWGGLLAALGYAVFSGWGVPSQRTVWMLATVTLLQAFGVRWPWLLVLALAAVVVTALDPWALLQAGFWLSFMAVGLLMASSFANGPLERPADAAPDPDVPVSRWRRGTRRAVHGMRTELRTQLVATLGLTPLTLVFFQQVSVVGFVANLIAIPLVTLVITPLALAGTALPMLWSVDAAIVGWMSAALGWLTSWSGAVWRVPVSPPWAQLCGLLAAALLIMPLPWRARLLAIPLAWPLLVPPLTTTTEGRFDVLAADIGQGTAVIVRTHAHLMLFDTGPQYSSDSDAGQRVLVPLLRARGDTRIDRLVLSHRDADHVGGARSVLTSLQVGEVLSSLEPTHPLLALASKPSRCEAGQSWLWDGVRFDVLSPPAIEYDAVRKPNAMSCVVRVSGGGRSLLLTGDIERDQEAALIAAFGAALRTDVLIAPHHGSRTSSTAAFLDAVRPSVGVFQAGYRNRFGHPAADVVARYRERSAVVVASPSCGAWQWRDVDALAGSCERDTARRYWHHRASGPVR